MSKKPGATIRPEASKTGTSAVSALPILLTLPSRIRTSVTVSSLRAGSTRRPFLISRSMSPQQQIKYGHAYSDTGRHLVEYDRVRTISDIGRNLNTPIHRSGMHDDHIIF